MKKKRPVTLFGQTIKTESPHGTVYVTVNSISPTEPFEIFVNVGKAGSDISADAEAIGRILSFALRMTSPITEIDRLTEMTRHLRHIGGSKDIGFGPKRIRSVPDAVAYALEIYLEQHQQQSIKPLLEAPVSAEAFQEGASTTDNKQSSPDHILRKDKAIANLLTKS
ncbi:hypothetical protein L0244_37210 [bacterium]|nr:hypothetical protein [bacterium]